ncbi:cytoplasmic dynein 2 heavy chain 1 [Scaptodrosophila lebanonensis]|uniref:Dynein heavy chain, cytoplasmic n=1 Tax=Drosophila lebanonensis TaxID=7225 RepID=A0A6J2U4R2_DROLE|nr:cytoplasmic dynein 2 heavy chain 1 [Scaptodrosophila lebanonensis]
MSHRTKFIINTSVEYFGARIPGTELDAQTAAILEFLEQDEHTVISAVHDKSDGKIKFQHRIPNEEVCLLFYKVPQVGQGGGGNGGGGGGGSVANEPLLGILTLEGGLVKSIYNSVSRVFSPHATAKRNEYSPEISGLLENLHVSLGSTLGLPQSGISNIKDEIKYWKQKLGQKSSSRLDRETAQVFIGMLENIERRIGIIEGDGNAGSTIEEFLDHAHNQLDELWRLPYNYPQQRMADLLDIIGNRLLEACLAQLLAEDIWSLTSFNVNNLMSHCIDTVDAWIQLCDSLTRLFWPNYVKHPWVGEPHMPKRGQLFKERLTEIRNIKQLYKQIASLLDDTELQEMFQEHAPFSDFNIFDTSILGQSKWNKALQHFEQVLQPIDERIATALKGQLHHHLSNPRQVIFIFSKYETLIQRPTVLELLTIEREQFLQSLHILLQDLRKAMTDTNMEPDTGHLSVICNECRWLKVVQYQIQEIEKVSHLINGREGFEKINKAVQEIKEETESLLRTNFEIWSGQCSTAVKSGELRLRDDQAVVKFEKEGRQLMRVTFNPKLVTFCQDVREFENLGYNVPLELRAAATHAAKHMCHARRLQQIATFHNTIGDRMIPCQRPIMLKNALELAALVQSETVAWQDEASVLRYVNTLQEAVSKLSADNTLLVGYHEQAKRTVMRLMSTDLFTQSQIWKDELRHLRELVATLERQGYSNLDAFKLHWDHQLYKVLEYQYLLGLLDMNNKLPDIHTKLVLRHRELCYSPPEEEIRDQYYTQLRRFIERPCGFRGLSDQSTTLFGSMVTMNQQHFGPLYERASQLFSKLADFKRIWLPWIALGCVDVEQLCGIHLSQADDWDRNFRECKHFSQKIAKLQRSEESIDCIVIDVLPLRSDIELIGRRYWEALASSLRSSILSDVGVVQEFLQSALQFLQNIPMDEGSITESGMKYEKIMSELPQVAATLDLVRAKDSCLAGWCKERVMALAGILQQWEQLQPLLENHAVILQRQVDVIKTQAQTQLQNLRNEAEKFQLRWESTIAELEANEQATLELFKERRAHWQQIQLKKQHLLDECAKFNMHFPADMLEPFVEIDAQMNSQAKQWEVYDNFLAELEPIMQEEWAIYRRRPYVLNEFIGRWESSVHESIDLPSKRIRQSVERLQAALPVLQQLQSDALSERHWARIFNLLHKQQTKPLHSILLADILDDMDALQAAAPELANIVRQAAAEQVVRQALVELDQWSVTAQFKLISRTDASGQPVGLIKDYQEVLNKIGDNQSLLQSAKNSAAFDSFSDQAALWESRLNSLDTLLSSLSHSQRRWVYLEPVFGAGTLQQEQALFKRIDKDFRYVMREIQADPRVTSVLRINNISVIVQTLETQLARCQQNLLSYITDKRNSFPRFYFLGDDDLLELLGQASKDADIVQRHIRKLFPGCHSLGIRQGPETGHFIINALHSAEGDELTLNQSVEMTGDIEHWLNKLVVSIQQTLRGQIFECYNNNNFSENNKTLDERLLNKYPIQVLATARALHFTRQAEQAIGSMALGKLQQRLAEEIAHCAALKQGAPNGSLPASKLRALLIDLVHYAAVAEQLVQENVMHVSDWHWLCQLRYYLTAATVGGSKGGGVGVGDGRQIYVRMVYAEFEYAYEFLGNANKLVHTRLTHKCYLILTQAMHMGLGGNPFGKAGTGKTECVKALGAMLGRLVLVFNCDENVDTESMGLILTGLARCGAWGCFDEFNRLQEATLSAISMLIQPIQSALKDKAATVQVGERTVQLNQHCGIFVTLNPAGVEYGGRQKLPGNIQALFRPIVMQQPEPGEIARVMLFVEGFTTAADMAARIVELFELCRQMLSAQRHYDWGLRELKTTLLVCGEGLRMQLARAPNAVANERATSTPSDAAANDEMSIVVRCLRSSTMSKLAQHDVARFEMLLRTVFPEIGDEPPPATSLQEALTSAFGPLALGPNSAQIEKALQLHEQLQKRMGVVVVGPPGCGKSTVIALLRQALMATNSTQIRVHTISPKSMSRVQLLGRLDADTRQWQDGVLTHTAVVVNQEPAHVHSWILCDGSIDPEWIEALNSVLDDNKLLTLPSGWRIQFGNNINFIFETDDVRHASPATISRMGIINMSYEHYPLQAIVRHELAKEPYGDLLQSYLDANFEAAAEWLEREQLGHIPGIGRSSLLHALLLQLHGTQTIEEFGAAMLRALLGFVTNERHQEFAQFVLQRANLYIANPNHAELTYYDKRRGALDQYAVGSIEPASTGGQLIETAAVKSYLGILDTLLDTCTLAPFLLIGPSGSGKTLLLQQAVQEHSGYQLATVNCSTQLAPTYLLNTLRQQCVTISGLRGREFKPKQARVVLFLKNLDLCRLDAWGASEVVELLLQLVQRKGFYADTLEWISVSGLQICASISGNLAKIAPRFLAINQFVRVGQPTAADMLGIVQCRMEPLLCGNGAYFRTNAATTNLQHVSECLMEFFAKLQATFTPASQQQGHYQFSPKCIMKLLDALSYYPPGDFNEALHCELLAMFKDRLATEEHVQQFEGILKQTMRKYYGKEKIYYVPKSPKSLGKLYGLTHDEWLDEVQRQITICNTESYNIVAPITEELLHYTAHIARTLVRQDGHQLILGQPGGRHVDAIYVAATLQQAKVLPLQGGQSYALEDFYNDLKLAMQTAALEQQNTYMLIEHCWLSYVPDILKPIEALLEGSEILELFGDELESVASTLKQAAQLEGYQESLGAYFMKRARENLHLVVVVDPSSAKVQEYFNHCPALYRQMTVLYVRPASRETLLMLPKKYIEVLGEGRQGGKVPVCSYFVDAVEDLLPEQAPCRYYQLITSYYHLYDNAASDIDKRLSKLQLGVDKLAAAHALVDTLKTNASTQEQALGEKRKLANEALEMISATMRNANEQKSSMLELKKQTQESSEQLKVRQREIQQELAEVEPILAEASTAVGQIKSEALSEIRSLRAPPETVRDILEGVLRLMGIRDTSWNSMKTFLAKRGIKEDIRSLDPARISPENCEAVERLLAAKGDSYEMKNAKRASAAAAPLAAWVKASVRYARVIQSIKPLEREQGELQRNLQAAEGEMEQLATGLDDVDKRVKQLSAKLQTYTQEAAVLELKLEEARGTLQAAQLLVEKLSAEYATWSEQLAKLKQAHKTLDTKMLLVALALNYFAGLALDKRSSLLQKLSTEMQLSSGFDLRQALITEQEQIIWESQGLARDVQIIENAALLRQMLSLPFGSCAVPLLLDPTQTASNWLAAHLRSSGRAYELTTQNNERLSYQLELAVRFGKTLLVVDCEELRPPLLQLVQGHTYVRFNKRQLEVGTKLVDLHENFQLVLCSKAPRFQMGSEFRGVVNVVLFTVTAAGLSDQLLSKAIVLKNSQLEQQRVELLQKEGELLKQRMELQNQLLEELSSAQGDILRNEQLLRTLEEVKQSSGQIDDALKKSGAVRQTLLAEFGPLRAQCAKAAAFYTGLILGYELSALVYIELFLGALRTLDAEKEQETRVYERLVRSVYLHLARATPRSSQLSLSLWICRQAYAESISAKEWELFVTNFMSSAADSSSILGRRTLPDCMSREAQLKLSLLLQQLPTLEDQLQLNKDYVWRGFIEQQTDDVLPAISSPFQRVLVAQIFRPDLIVTQLRSTCNQLLGIAYDAGVQPSVEQLLEESSNERPILMITQAENDPATELKSTALRKWGDKKYQELAIGRGIEQRALEAVRQAAAQGQWLCVKNVHLVPHWLTQLERELGQMTKAPDFRLWLVCESTVGFSEAAIYRCLKVRYEQPRGLKQQVQRMLQNYAAMQLDQGNKQQQAKCLKMRVVMFLLSAVLQQRRQYVPQGWSKYYEFGEADLKAALGVLSWMDAQLAGGRCDWLLLQRLCESVAYGGRVDNARDLEVLRSYLNKFCCADVLSNRWTPLGLSFSIPTSAQLQDYYGALDKLPDVDEPAIYGLASQAHQQREIEQSRVVIKELRAAYYGGTAGDAVSTPSARQKLEQQIKPILSLWRKLAVNCSVAQTVDEMQAMEQPLGMDSPWSLFVLAELQLGSNLYKLVHRTLAQLHAWLKETQTQAGNVDANALQTLAEHQVPATWQKLWPGPASAVDYLRGLIVRASEAERRYREQLHVKFATSLNLVHIFNCENLLACLKLLQAHTFGVSAQCLHLVCVGATEAVAGGDDGIVLHIAPLKLDGSDGIKPKSFEFYLTYKTEDQIKSDKNKALGNKYSLDTDQASRSTKLRLPLYSRAQRDRVICYLELENEQITESEALLAGLAMVVEDH